MTDRVLRIIVDTANGTAKLDQLEDGLQDVEKQEKKTAASTKALGNAFRTLLAGLSIREIGRAADAYTTMGNKIRLVTDSQAELNNVQDEVFALAQRTRSSLASTTDLYSRAARAVEEFGGSQRETLQFTEAINQTLQISGATAAEAAGSTIQFAQGLQAGALRGEELNSVLEGNNRLARVLAKEFGVGIGQLRKLGEEGKLVGDRIFKAVIAAGPTLRNEFQDINPTIEQTITTMGNFATVIVGSFNEAAGVTEGLVDIFTLTEEEAADLATTVRDLGLSFREFVEVATVAVVNFVETVGPKFGQIEAEIVKIIAAITRDEDLFLAALEGQDEFDAELDKIKAKLDAEFEAIRRNSEARRAASEDRLVDLDEPGGGGTGGGVVAISKEAQDLLDKQAKLLESLQQQSEAQEEANRTGREYSQVLAEMKIEALGAANGNTVFTESAIDLAGRLQKAKEEAAALAVEEKARLDAIAEADQLTESLLTTTERYAIELAKLQDQLAKGLITEETFQRAVDRLDELGSETDDFFRRARENSQDILADFFAGGFDSLDDFGRAFADMLLQLTSQALAANLFNALLGTQGGGGGGIIGQIFGGASAAAGTQFGGGVQAGQATNTGESGRFGSEVFIPNVGGTVVPINGPRGNGGGGGAPPVVNLTNINTIDQSEITGAFNDGAGDQVLLNRFSSKPGAFRRALNL